VDGQLTFSPSPVNFGSPAPGSVTPVQVTATNTGTEDLTVTGLRVASDAGVFVLSAFPQPLPILAPLASFNLTVTYNAPSNGAANDELLGTFAVADTAVAARTVQDLLSGNQFLGPCSLGISPSSLNFGLVPPNTVGTRQVTLTDTGGTACQVSAIALSPTTDPSFGSQPSALTVQPGSTQQITVTFSPTSATPPAVHTGQLTFKTGDPQNPSATVPLSAVVQAVSCYCGGWPKWHMDGFNSGQSNADTSGLQGKVAWEFPIGRPGAGKTYIDSPIVNGESQLPTSSGEVIFQMDMTGALHAIVGGPSGGTALLTQHLSSPAANPQPSTPALIDWASMVIATGSAGSPPNLYDLSATVAVTFSEAFGQAGFASTPGLADDGTVFLADAHGGSPACGGVDGGDQYSAVAFSADGGALTQIAGLALPFTNVSGSFGVVVDANDNSYWGNNGQFFAVSSPVSGFQPLAAWPACGVSLTPPSLRAVSNLAIDALTTGNLYAYSAWEIPAADGGYTVQGNIAALTPATGAELWIFDIPAATLPAGWTALQSDVGNASPAVAYSGTVYVGGGNGLYALDSTTGKQQWLFNSANVSSSPAIGGDGTIFFGCDDGNFYAVTPAGQQRFVVPTGGPISSSPAIAPDGTVYFVSDDGNLYAID
jgi:outer membrane protein assembly factor BamB